MGALVAVAYLIATVLMFWGMDIATGILRRKRLMICAKAFKWRYRWDVFTIVVILGVDALKGYWFWVVMIAVWVPGMVKQSRNRARYHAEHETDCKYGPPRHRRKIRIRLPQFEYKPKVVYAPA